MINKPPRKGWVSFRVTHPHNSSSRIFYNVAIVQPLVGTLSFYKQRRCIPPRLQEISSRRKSRHISFAA